MTQGGRRAGRYRAMLACFLLLTLMPTVQTLAPTSAALADPYPDRDGFFGVVGRDPYYEWNTDTAHFNNDVNRMVLENIVKEMAAAGVKWVRIEFFAEYGDAYGPGRMPYEKYDWFLTDLMRRYNMNVLGLLSYGIVRDTNYTYILNKPYRDTSRSPAASIALTFLSGQDRRPDHRGDTCLSKYVHSRVGG